MSDLIDRQAAIDAIRASTSKYAGFMEMELYTDDDAVEAINGVPSAEPVRHGKWIFNPSDAFEAMFTKPKCSECGFESADGGNYCPNCGADMRGEEEWTK